MCAFPHVGRSVCMLQVVSVALENPATEFEHAVMKEALQLGTLSSLDLIDRVGQRGRLIRLASCEVRVRVHMARSRKLSILRLQPVWRLKTQLEYQSMSGICWWVSLSTLILHM